MLPFNPRRMMLSKARPSGLNTAPLQSPNRDLAWIALRSETLPVLCAASNRRDQSLLQNVNPHRLTPICPQFLPLSCSLRKSELMAIVAKKFAD
jgi:hypothetical protein